LCGGDSIRLITEIGNGGTFSAWLKDGIPLVDSSSILYVTEPGNYQVVAEHFCGADTTPFIVVTSFEITADFGFSPQDEIFVSENILFSDNSSPEPQLWFWDFGDDFTSNSPNPTHNYTLSGTYPVSLVVQNIQGCKDTLIRNITIFDQGTLFIPTAFTPNDDGNNDIFSVKGLEITELSLSIWDRWGKLIYEIRQVGDGWDGTVEGEDAPEGVYMCSYSYTLRGGRAKKGTSSITLTR
jgi:gliding motility-associated-like protein